MLAPIGAVLVVLIVQFALPNRVEAGEFLIWTDDAKIASWVLLGGCLVAFTIVWARQRRRVISYVFVATGVVTLLLACGGLAMSSIPNRDPRIARPVLAIPGGASYRVIHGVGFATRVAYLTRARAENDLFVTLESLGGPVALDSPNVYAPILVPARRTPSQRDGFPASGIYVAPTGLLIVAARLPRHPAGPLRACLAFDAGGDGLLSPCDTLALSPFVLFGADDVGDDAELDAWLDSLPEAFVTRDQPYPMHGEECGVPTDDALVAALSHPSEWVRDAARRIAEVGGAARYPRTTARLR